MQPDLSGYTAPRLVEDPAALRQCLQDLGTHSTIAFDLEFDSHRHSYGVTLCLLQVATPVACYIIDPFAGIGLSGLYRLFEDERIQKIVHSPGEDLRLLHALQCYPKNLFDTEVVAKLLNYEQTSLAVMLQEKLGYTMNKQQQRSNWLRRPLTPAQVEYAAADVSWLHPLKALLEEEAIHKGLMPYVLEEQESLSTTIYQSEAKTYFLKQADLRTLSPYEQHVLNGLFVYRDELAQQVDKPAYQVIDEPLLRGLAAGTLLPRDLLSAKGVYRNLKSTSFTDGLSARLKTICREADGLALAHALPVRQPSSATRISKEAVERDRAGKFAPIQQVLIQRFGAHAARFMLSNGMVNDLLKRAIRISGIKYRYRQALIMDTAKELGIDLSGYE